MQMPSPSLLALVYGVSEAGLAWRKRSRDDSVDADRRSLRLLWLTIVFSIAAAFVAREILPAASFLSPRAVYRAGFALFCAGLALRWYAIVYLGRFFTVNVAIHSAHEVIDTGPYRFVRHPSYSGALLAFIGLALTLANWASWLVMLVPIGWVFARRMSIEERALAGALGAPYTQYMQRTKRLVPLVY